MAKNSLPMTKTKINDVKTSIPDKTKLWQPIFNIF